MTVHRAIEELLNESTKQHLLNGVYTSFRGEEILKFLRRLFNSWRRKPKKRKRKSRAVDRKEVEESGRWYFKRDILEQLNEYFVCIAELKKTDPDGYDLYSRVGGVICSPKSKMTWGDLPPSWRAGQLPSFGSVTFLRTDDSHDDKVPAKFVCFRKLSRPSPLVELSKGVVYSVSLFHMDSDNRHLKASTEFHVAVEGDEVRLLKELQISEQNIPVKKTKGRKPYPHKIIHRRWDFPKPLRWLYEYNRSSMDYDDSISEYGTNMFKCVIGHHENATADIRVRVSRGQLVGMFAVDLLRTPYFFADREPVIIDGVKKKIFHIVKTHPRYLQDGRVVHVHSHFRGLRRFEWNGYKINITMPGFHHRDLLEFDVGGVHLDPDKPKPRGLIDSKVLGKEIDSHVNV